MVRALVLDRYGSTDSLKIEEVENPTPGLNEVLVKVMATSVNDYDWTMVQGKPYLYRLMYGLTKPRNRIPGMELAGVVVAIGTAVSTFEVGDEVYGDISEYGFGTFAEYVSVDVKALRPKPANMSFEVAASLPHAAGLAIQGLAAGDLGKNSKILVNGAGGGVGAVAIYLAKQLGAEVTGVDRGEKLQQLLAIGYDHVVDYQHEDFTRSGQQYDFILDTKTNRSTFRYLSALVTGGGYITVGGSLHRLLQLFLLKPLLSRFYKKHVGIIALRPNQGLKKAERLFAAGQLVPVIDGPHQFEDLPQLIDTFGSGLHAGKLVVSVTEPV